MLIIVASCSDDDIQLCVFGHQTPGYVLWCNPSAIGELSSTFDEFLAALAQFDNDHGVDFYAATCFQSATFVRPLFAFYFPLFFTGKNNK